MVRDEAGPDAPYRERVMVVQAYGVPNPIRRPRRRRKAKAVDHAAPETVPVLRVTVAGSDRFADQKGASTWLDEIADDVEHRADYARDGLDAFNRALDALHELTEDPAIGPVDIGSSLAVRIGFGTGDQVADGEWTEARQLPSFQREVGLDRHRQVALRLAGKDEDDPDDGASLLN